MEKQEERTMENIPLRKDVPVENTWALEDIFKTREDWEAALAKLAEMPAEAEAFQGKLGESGETLKRWFDRNEEVTLLVEDVANYAMRLSDTDSANSEWQAMKGRAIGVLMRLSAASSFADPEIVAIPEETLAAFYAACPGLEKYRRAIESVRVLKDHVLSPAEEKLLSAAGEMAHAPGNIGEMLRNADMTFPDAVDGQGTAHTLTAGTYIGLMQSGDRALRESAFRNVYATYGAWQNTAAAILDAQMKQLKFFADARKFGSMLEAALAATEVPTAVYHNLLDAVEAHLPAMERYMALRKRVMGLEELHMYDVYTPLFPEAGEKITFDEAKETVLEAMAPLGEEYRDVVRGAFRSRWIDVYENKGKRSGAYSAGARPHPYVLLNHRDDMNSMFTLIHEMGHAMHSYLSKQHQPVVYSDYVIFVAEVASTCNEMLLMQYLLGRETDPGRRAYLINHYLEEIRQTLYRQTMFARFELDMAERVEAGETLTAEWLNERYGELNARYYGPDMARDPEIALEWARIPHFFYNFYVFQYATGISAAIALARRILTEGEPAVRDYLKFLSSGCSTDPISLLKIAGVDMASPEPVNAALDYFGELVDELERLTAAR